MLFKKNFLFINLLLIFSFLVIFTTKADNHNVYEILDLIQKDLKTLEKAVYSQSSNSSESFTDNINLDTNSEDVLTRHLLKLSEIENQFQALTNKFEEINFKLDKLSNRLSKVQADNQIRFQELENLSLQDISKEKLTKKPKEELLPGSSQPQDLGSISYKDTSTEDKTQKIDSIETTASIVTETFQSEEKILPKATAEKQ